MGKISLSPELKKKIANLTGLTYLASNIEKFSDTDGVHIDNMLNFYASQRDALKTINVEVKKEIMDENPSLKLNIVIPGEGGLTPVNPDEKVTITITSVPSDAKITINDEEKSGIEVTKGESITYKVEKDGYKTVEETIEATETKVIEVVLEEKQLPTVSSDLPLSFEKNTDVEYNVTTVPNDYQNEMVYGECDINIPDDNLNLIQYWEPNEEVPSWHNLPKNESGKYYFGTPGVGFPLSALSSKFKINVKEASTYNATISIIAVNGTKELCKTSIEFNVTEPVEMSNVNQVSTQKENVEATNDVTDAPATTATTATTAQTVSTQKEKTTSKK